MSKYLNETTKKLVMIILGVVIVFVIVLVGLMIYKSVVGTKVSYEKLKSITEKAAIRYFDDKQLLPITEGDKSLVTIETLVMDKYMKPLQKLTDDTGCTGKVTVMNNGGLYLYNTYLDCNDYETTTLADEVKKQVVESGAGLYKIADQYYFRGEFVNNYVKFAGTTWRIMRIDADGNIRLIKQESERRQYLWDDRYNRETNRNTGINDYTLSRIRETLEGFYRDPKLFPDEARKFMIAADFCMGSRAVGDNRIDQTIDCGKMIENQYIGLITTVDYSLGSIDPKCTEQDEYSCQNYNYLADVAGNGWTGIAVSGNTYQAFTMAGGLRRAQDAKIKDYLNFVIYVSGDNVYKQGSGTPDDPYVLS